MTLRQAQQTCTEIDAQHKAQVKKVKWTDVYSSEQAIIDALNTIYIPKSKTAPMYTFKGYEYIYSFADRVQKCWTLNEKYNALSEKQMKQAKRLALEIKKAAAIRHYKF